MPDESTHSTSVTLYPGNASRVPSNRSGSLARVEFTGNSANIALEPATVHVATPAVLLLRDFVVDVAAIATHLAATATGRVVNQARSAWRWAFNDEIRIS